MCLFGITNEWCLLTGRMSRKHRTRSSSYRIVAGSSLRSMAPNTVLLDAYDDEADKSKSVAVEEREWFARGPNQGELKGDMKMKGITNLSLVRDKQGQGEEGRRGERCSKPRNKRWKLDFHKDFRFFGTSLPTV